MPAEPRAPTPEEITKLADALEHAWSIYNGPGRWRDMARAAWPLAYAAGWRDADAARRVYPYTFGVLPDGVPAVEWEVKGHDD